VNNLTVLGLHDAVDALAQVHLDLVVHLLYVWLDHLVHRHVLVELLQVLFDTSDLPHYHLLIVVKFN